MAEYRGLAYLRRKLDSRRVRVLTRYKYYDMKNLVRDFNIVTPPEFRNFNEVLGWCGKAVDNLADRLVWRQFREDNFDLNQIYQMNSADVLFDSAIQSAMISSCCFLFISRGVDGFPRLQVIDGGNATGVLDPITHMLTEGYVVLERDDNDRPKLEAYLIPGSITYYQSGEAPWTESYPGDYPMLVPIIHRPDAVRPFGRSRISRACMSIVQGALRTLKRSEISAEFYSFPQKYLLGTDPETERLDNRRASISSFLEITADENGNKPTLGQFQQQSMSPYTEQLRTFAALFSGETGLTLDDLGFVTDNPSSAEAIKAAHENLRLMAKKAQRSFGVGFLNAGFLAACVRDDTTYKRQQIYLTKSVWEPVFEPDAAMLSGIGDGASKINQAVPGYFGVNNLHDMTGIPPE